MKLNIDSLQDAARVLEYFNHFHDGYIARIEIASRQYPAEDGSVVCSGLFDVVLRIAHSNYGDGSQPPDRQIVGAFSEVSRICLDFHEVNECDWFIYELQFHAEQDLFSLILVRNQYEADAWQIRRHELFRFRSAEFCESLAY